MAIDKMRTIRSVKAVPPATLELHWSDGIVVAVDIERLLANNAFRTLRNSAEFARANVGEWGHSVEWASGAELGADALWRESLSALARDDARQFLDWRMRHGLSLTKAADALGLSRRMVAYYSNAEKPVPKHVLLACRGWEVGPKHPRRTKVKPELASAL